MDNFDNLLQKMRKRPGMYSDEESIFDLEIFLSGYYFAGQDLKVDLTKQESELQELWKEIQALNKIPRDELKGISRLKRLKRILELQPKIAEYLEQIYQSDLQEQEQEPKTEFNLMQSRTWELCGAFEAIAPREEDIVERKETGEIVTNYAENVDDVIYGGS